MSNVIAEGYDIQDLANQTLQPGQSGQVIAYVNGIPSTGTLAQVQQSIQSQGVILNGPVVYDDTLGAVVINFRNNPASYSTDLGEPVALAMPATSAISLGLGLLAVVGVLIMGWQLTSTLSSGIGPIWVVLGLVGLVIFIKSREGHETIQAFNRAAEYTGKAAVEHWAKRPHVDPNYREQAKVDVWRASQGSDKDRKEAAELAAERRKRAAFDLNARTGGGEMSPGDIGPSIYDNQ